MCQFMIQLRAGLAECTESEADGAGGVRSRLGSFGSRPDFFLGMRPPVIRSTPGGDLVGAQATALMARITSFLRALDSRGLQSVSRSNNRDSP